MQHNRIRWSTILAVLISAFSSVFIGSQEAQTSSPPSLVRARAAFARGQLDDAEKQIWTVLSSDSDQPEALTLLGMIRVRQKRYAEAEALFRRTLQLLPDSAVVHRNLADALIAQNRVDAAVAEYEEVVKLAPQDHSAKVELAHLYLSHGQFAQALSSLESIPRNHFPPEAIPARAASLLGLGRKDEAAALIPQAKQSPTLSAELAEVFLNGNAPEFAIRAAENGLATSPRAPAHLYFLNARALQATGHPSSALSNFRQALTRDPKSVEAMIGIAAIESSANQHQDSLRLLKRAYTLQPNSIEVLHPLIVEAIKAGEPKTALEAAQTLAEESPENLEDIYLAAAAMLEGKDFATAASLFEKYTSQQPDNSKAFLGLGIAQLAQQHYPEATKALERSLQIDPQQADAEYELGLVASQTGKAEEAVQHFERTIQLRPQHAKALASLGQQYLETGDLEKAHTALEGSVAANPDDAKAQYDLALVLSKLGKTEEARQHMERSRALKTAEDLGKNPASMAAQP